VLAVLEVSLLDRRSSSSFGGSASFEEGLGPLRSASILLLLHHPLPPNGPVMKTRLPVQPGLGMGPNYGWHKSGCDNLVVRHHGLRAPSADMPADRGKGMGATPKPKGLEGPKLMIVGAQGLDDGGVGHNGDHDSGGVGWQLAVAEPTMTSVRLIEGICTPVFCLSFDLPLLFVRPC
jgi:hypothetical protein